MRESQQKKNEYVKLTDAQILERYAKLADLLNEVLSGMGNRQFDLRLNADSWSIRQIVHHNIDSDFLVQNIILAALGNSGCQYDQSWYPTDNSWVETLVYAKRPLEPSLELFKISHTGILSLIEFIPDALERNAQVRIENKPEWQNVIVRNLLLSRLYHTDHHLRQIEEIRQTHNL